MIPRPWVLVMAAGSSRRFGGSKLLAQVDGESLLRRAVRAALGSRPDGVIVVLGCRALRLRRELRGYPVRVALNRRWRTGLASSLRTGIDALPRSAPAAIVLLADQIAVGPAELELLTAAWRRHRGSMVASRSGEVIGPPALFPRRHFRALRRLRGDSGAKRLLTGRTQALIEVELPDAIHDVDGPGDLLTDPA
jgi:CTP:molybdopterin cytidylyltransferase MocA